MESMTDLFGPVISSYSRHQAIEDGVLVDLMQDTLSEVCRQHYKYPIACTAAVFGIMERAIASNHHCNDLRGVLHDMLWMSKVMKKRVDEQTVLFRVKITGAGRQNLYTSKMMCGPGDDGEPVLTIMLPQED